jgi:hypothetical protein
VLAAQFATDYLGGPSTAPRFAALAVDAELLELASTLVAADDLRAFPAVQLASALAVRSVDPVGTAFACYDRSLRAAAARRSFDLVPS